MLKNKSISRIFFYYKYFPFSNESKILNNPYGIFREIVLVFFCLDFLKLSGPISMSLEVTKQKSLIPTVLTVLQK